jgi:hypothetical protein
MTYFIQAAVVKKVLPKAALRTFISLGCVILWVYSCANDTQITATESETEIHLTGMVYDSCDNCLDTSRHPLGNVVVCMAALGFADTTDELGAYEIKAMVPDNQLPASAIKDSLFFFYNNDKKASLPIAAFIDTLQDVYLVHHRISWMFRSLFVRFWQIARIEAEVVRQTGPAPDTVTMRLTLTQNPTGNGYAADTFFTKRANVIDTYTVQIRVFGEDSSIIGMSNPRIFNDLSDSVVFEYPEFDPGNLIPRIDYASQDSFEYGYTPPFMISAPDRRHCAGDSVPLLVASQARLGGPFYNAIKHVFWDHNDDGIVDATGFSNTFFITATTDTYVCPSATVVYFNNDTATTSLCLHVTPPIPLPPNTDLIETAPIGLDYTDRTFYIDTISGMDTTRKLSGAVSYKLICANRAPDEIIRIPQLRGAGSFTPNDTLVLRIYQASADRLLSKISLQCLHGIYEYRFQGAAPLPGAWFRYSFPLSGNSDWQRTAKGSPDLKQVTNIEIVVDGLNTETLWLDGLAIQRGY